MGIFQICYFECLTYSLYERLILIAEKARLESVLTVRGKELEIDGGLECLPVQGTYTFGLKGIKILTILIPLTHADFIPDSWHKVFNVLRKDIIILNAVFYFKNL